MLDLSQRDDLKPFVRPVGDLMTAANQTQVGVMITGAFARDLHLAYACGLQTGRMTEDIDFAVAVHGWDDFARLKASLVQSGSFSDSPDIPHRLKHVATSFPIDLVPFGDIEDSGRSIAWPPRGEIRMRAFGLREAYRVSEDLRFPAGIVTRVVTLPALAMLKMVAWADRHLSAPRKDAHDLMLIVSNYLECGGHERLVGEFGTWTTESDFDYELSGPRMLGHDIGVLLEAPGRIEIEGILIAQSDATIPSGLAAEMMWDDPDHARRLLSAMLRGLSGAVA